MSSGNGLGNVKPEYRKSELRIRRFDKCAYDTSAATHRLRSTVDDVAEQASAIVESHKGDNIGFSGLPFGLHSPAYDRKSFDGACAATFVPFDGPPANRATLRGRPAEMVTSYAEWQQQSALACRFPVRSRFATASRRRIFHVASSSRTPCVANRPPMPWVIVILAFGTWRSPASCRSCTTASIRLPMPAARPG
jgi:hypothetical protein